MAGESNRPLGGYAGPLDEAAPPEPQTPQSFVRASDYSGRTWEDDPMGYAVDRLQHYGWTPEQAAGIVGNMWHESAGDPAASGDRGTSFGLFQHHAGRKRALVDYANRTGRRVDDPDLQIDFMNYELATDYADVGDALRGADTYQDATKIFSNRYEKPGVPAMGSRLSWAKAAYNLVTPGAAEAAPPPGAPPPAGEAEIPTAGRMAEPLGMGEKTRRLEAVPGGYAGPLDERPVSKPVGGYAGPLEGPGGPSVMAPERSLYSKATDWIYDLVSRKEPEAVTTGMYKFMRENPAATQAQRDAHYKELQDLAAQNAMTLQEAYSKSIRAFIDTAIVAPARGAIKFIKESKPGVQAQEAQEFFKREAGAGEYGPMGYGSEGEGTEVKQDLVDRLLHPKDERSFTGEEWVKAPAEIVGALVPYGVTGKAAQAVLGKPVTFFEKTVGMTAAFLPVDAARAFQEAGWEGFNTALWHSPLTAFLFTVGGLPAGRIASTLGVGLAGVGSAFAAGQTDLQSASRAFATMAILHNIMGTSPEKAEEEVRKFVKDHNLSAEDVQALTADLKNNQEILNYIENQTYPSTVTTEEIKVTGTRPKLSKGEESILTDRLRNLFPEQATRSLKEISKDLTVRELQRRGGSQSTIDLFNRFKRPTEGKRPPVVMKPGERFPEEERLTPTPTEKILVAAARERDAEIKRAGVQWSREQGRFIDEGGAPAEEKLSEQLDKAVQEKGVDGAEAELEKWLRDIEFRGGGPFLEEAEREKLRQRVGPIWRSQMRNRLEGLISEVRGRGEHYADLIKGWADKGQFKRAEWQWSGIDQWLREQTEPVTKEQILDKLNREGLTNIEVVEIGEPRSLSRPERAQAETDLQQVRNAIEQVRGEVAAADDALAAARAEAAATGQRGVPTDAARVAINAFTNATERLRNLRAVEGELEARLGDRPAAGGRIQEIRDRLAAISNEEQDIKDEHRAKIAEKLREEVPGASIEDVDYEEGEVSYIDPRKSYDSFKNYLDLQLRRGNYTPEEYERDRRAYAEDPLAVPSEFHVYDSRRMTDFIPMEDIRRLDRLEGEHESLWDELHDLETSRERGATKFKDYMRLPSGGKNYREFYLTLPRDLGKPVSLEGFAKFLEDNYPDRISGVEPLAVAKMFYDGRDPLFREYQSQRGPTFDLPRSHLYGKAAADVNRVAHIFTDDRWVGGKVPDMAEFAEFAKKRGYDYNTLTEEQERTLSDEYQRSEGAKKYLVLWEVQSDWRGRRMREAENRIAKDAGYDRRKNKAAFNAYIRRPEVKKQIRELYNSQENLPGAPAFPIQSNWMETALRRMLRYAAEQGYDGIAWANGETVRDRWDLARELSALRWDGTNLMGIDHGGYEVITREAPDVAALEDYIGKELADKLGAAEHVWRADLVDELEKVRSEIAPARVLRDALDAEADVIYDKYRSRRRSLYGRLRDIPDVSGSSVIEGITTADPALREQFRDIVRRHVPEFDFAEYDDLHREQDAARRKYDVARERVHELAVREDNIENEMREARHGLRELTGLDLKIGGEWALNQYDHMMPLFMGKYGKQWEASVGKADLSTAPEREHRLFLDRPEYLAIRDNKDGTFSIWNADRGIDATYMTDRRGRDFFMTEAAAFEALERYKEDYVTALENVRYDGPALTIEEFHTRAKAIIDAERDHADKERLEDEANEISINMYGYNLGDALAQFANDNGLIRANHWARMFGGGMNVTPPSREWVHKVDMTKPMVEDVLWKGQFMYGGFPDTSELMTRIRDKIRESKPEETEPTVRAGANTIQNSLAGRPLNREDTEFLGGLRTVLGAGEMTPLEAAQRYFKRFWGERRQEMQRARIELNQFKRNLGRLDNEAFLNLLKRDVTAYQRGEGASPVIKDLMAVYDKLRMPFEDFMRTISPDWTGVENYFRQMFKRPPGGWEKWFAAHKTSIEGPKGFLKRREIPDWATGLEMGLVPKKNNIVDLIRTDLEEKTQFMSGHKLMADYLDAGVVTGLPAGERLPMGKYFIEGPSGRMTHPKWGHYIADRDVANFINGQLEPGLLAAMDKSISHPWLRPIVKGAGKFWMGGTNAVRQIEVFGPWHFYTTDNHARALLMGNVPADILAEVLGSTAGTGTPGKSLTASLVPGSTVVLNRKIAKVIQDTWVTGKGPEWAKDAWFNITEGGGDIHADPRTIIPRLMKGSDQYGNILRDGLIDLANDLHDGKVGKAVSDLIHAGSAPIMKYMVPNTKVTMHYLLTREPLEALRSQYNVKGLGADARTADPADQKTFEVERMKLNQDTWKTIDWTFGMIPRENVMMRNILKDIFGFVIQFPTWNIGTLGLMKEAVKGAGKSFIPGTQQTPTSRQALRLAAGLLVTQGIMGTLIHRATTGQWPTQFKDIYFPIFTPGDPEMGVEEERGGSASYLKTGYHFATKPIATTLGMQNHVIAMLSELYNNETWNHTYIRTPYADLLTQIKDYGLYGKERIRPFLMQQIELGETPLTKWGWTVGWSRAPKAIGSTAAEDVMHQYQSKGTFRRTRKEAEEFKIGKQVTTLLRQGKEAEARKIVDPLVDSGKLNPEKADRWWADAELPAKVVQWRRMNLEWQLRAFEVATPKEKEVYEPHLREKVDNASDFDFERLKPQIDRLLGPPGSPGPTVPPQSQNVDPRSYRAELMQMALTGDIKGFESGVRSARLDLGMTGAEEKQLRQRVATEKFNRVNKMPLNEAAELFVAAPPEDKRLLRPLLRAKFRAARPDDKLLVESRIPHFKKLLRGATA